MVASPVGFRCPECSRGPRAASYQVDVNRLVLSAGAGLIVALTIGFVWGMFPEWGFHCSLLLGFGVVETMAYVSKYRRGRELLGLAIACIVVGLVVSRLVIAWDDPVLTMQMLWNNANNEFVRARFRLDPIPDYLFAAIPFGIAYVRFR